MFLTKNLSEKDEKKKARERYSSTLKRGLYRFVPILPVSESKNKNHDNRPNVRLPERVIRIRHFSPSLYLFISSSLTLALLF